MASAASPFSLAASLGKKKDDLLERLSQPANDSSPFVIIMGNEAGDTDSMASSILLAHLLSHPDAAGPSSKFAPSTTFVPLAQLPRADLKLRAENEMLLSVLQLKSSDLLFLDDLSPKPSDLLSLDDINLGKVLLRSDVLLGLTDHPQLSGKWNPVEWAEGKVQIVVDHHADDGAHKDARLRVLKGPENGTIGSCVSVIVDLFKNTEAMKQLPAPLADLALAALLIDTADLRPLPRGKATPTDLEAGQILLQRSSFGADTRNAFLQAAVQAGGQVAAQAAEQEAEEADEMAIETADVQAKKAAESASAYYRILSALKLDVSRLNTADLLRRDYKEQAVTDLGSSDVKAGFSSVPVGLSDWVHERHGDGPERWDDYWRAIREWMKKRSLDIAVVGTSFREHKSADEGGKHKRELILAYKQPAALSDVFPSLVKYLETDAYAEEKGNEMGLKLLLDQPWKGWRRVEETGKKERVEGLDKQSRWKGDEEMRVAVWLQRNGQASRKVYLPAVVHALKKAAVKGR